MAQRRVARETQGRFWKRLDEVERQARLASAAFEGDTPAKQQRRIAAALADPLVFCRTYLPHYFISAPADFHGEWLQHLDEAIVTVLDGRKAAAAGRPLKDAKRMDATLACPRGFAKTTVISFGGTLWALVARKLPFFLLVCDIQAQAEEIVESIADELDDNPLLKHDFGDLLGSRRATKWGSQATTVDGCRVQALGYDQSFRGIKYRQYRPMLAILDDPESDEEVRNDKLREKTRQKLTGKLRLALEPWSAMVICQNLIHHDCLSAHVVLQVRAAEEAVAKDLPVSDFRFRKWRVFVYTALREDDTSAWESRFSTEYLHELREEDPEAFALEMMQQAIVLGAQTFRRSLVRYYEDDELAKLTKLHSVLSVDPSKGKTERADFSAIIILELYENNITYCRVADLKRRTALTILHDWFKLFIEWTPTICVCETVAFQELLKDVFELLCQEYGLYPPVRAYEDLARKEMRIERLERPVNSGGIRFKREQIELLRQLFDWPTHPYDDGPDGLEMAWSEIQRYQRTSLKKGQSMFGSLKSKWLPRMKFGKGAW